MLILDDTTTFFDVKQVDDLAFDLITYVVYVIVDEIELIMPKDTSFYLPKDLLAPHRIGQILVQYDSSECYAGPQAGY